MAKTKEVKVSETLNESPVITEEKVKETVVEVAQENKFQENKTSENKPQENKTSENKLQENKSGPTYEELLSLVQGLAAEVQSLKSAQNNPQQVQSSQSTDNATSQLLNILANKKSDREVTIVHNREMLGGLSTNITLSSITIDFHTIGEQRVLSWQQFEECVSKYRTFFEKEIILLGPEHADLAQRYAVKCVKRGNNRIIEREDLVKLPTMATQELEDYYKSLSETDKDFVCSYWLGKCYNKEEGKKSGFYDRYKIELLNSLSGKHVFDNLLALMNGDIRDNT